MTWTIGDIEQTFPSYMADRGHTIIEGHSVRSPTDDVLFTTAGMHPLIPYLHGDEAHPGGTRLTDVQRCVRTTDIDEVGDNRHLTVFEMLGNWSLGDYFKETSIPQSFDLLTGTFGIDPHSLYVTVFGGSDAVPADPEAPEIWRQTFVDAGVDPATFDGDLAFHFADTLGYPAELSVEEAERIGMTIVPDWQDRFEVLREEQRARSRG